MSALTAESPDDFILTAPSVWITAGEYSIYIHRNDEGLTVEAYPLHDEAASDALAGFTLDTEVTA